MKNIAMLIVLAVSLALAAACGGLGKTEFKEFKSDAGKFTVNAPDGKMTETSQNVATAAGSIQLTMYQSTAGNNTYMAGYSDFPEALIKQVSVDKLLDGARDGAVANVNGKLISDTKIERDGNTGKEIVLEAKAPNGQEATAKAHYFLINNRLYQAMAIVPKGQTGGAEVDDYLKSFKITE